VQDGAHGKTLLRPVREDLDADVATQTVRAANERDDEGVGISQGGDA
jgi:hypothetical protein